MWFITVNDNSNNDIHNNSDNDDNHIIECDDIINHARINVANCRIGCWKNGLPWT